MPNPLLEDAKKRAKEGLQKIEKSEELIKAIEASGFSTGDLKKQVRTQRAKLTALSEIRS